MPGLGSGEAWQIEDAPGLGCSGTGFTRLRRTRSHRLASGEYADAWRADLFGSDRAADRRSGQGADCRPGHHGTGA